MKIQPLVAEFLGTFFLCFAGIASILSATPAVGSGAGIVGVALAHGLAEFVMTFLLMIAIFGTAVDQRGQAVKIGGFGIGLTVAFDILAGGALTGASMNPARSFGPALVMGNFAWHWVYWLAPVAGACVAAILYEKVILQHDLPKSLAWGLGIRDLGLERQRALDSPAPFVLYARSGPIPNP